jgi:CDP-4-dehydro-6-deoxyglucose reductase, E1
MKSDHKIRLVNDTITKENVSALTNWLGTNPRLTKGRKTIEFENNWSDWQGRKHSVFVNSGSSANLAMLYALMLSGRMKNKKVVVPAVSWVTTVAPIIQLGLEPILCDTDTGTLGVDVGHLKNLIFERDPAVLIIVHVLGIPCKMDEIIELCVENDIILLEDSCESVGSTYAGTKTGNFGLMSSFSTYYGHHFSTIEGGIVNTDDDELYNLLLSIRSHGWDRDLPKKEQKRLRKKYGINDFRALYTFYYPGFNLRSTDLQAFIGIEQLKTLDKIVKKRNQNFLLYQSLIKNDYWKMENPENVFISNFAYPVISSEKGFKKLVKSLNKNEIEIRPLVCGSINEQPFWRNSKNCHANYDWELMFAEIIHHQGLYLPNNYQITEDEIKFICDVVNSALK